MTACQGANYIIRICILLVICQNVNFLLVQGGTNQYLPTLCFRCLPSRPTRCSKDTLLSLRLCYSVVGVAEGMPPSVTLLLRVNKFETLPQDYSRSKDRYNFPQLFSGSSRGCLAVGKCMYLLQIDCRRAVAHCCS